MTMTIRIATQQTKEQHQNKKQQQWQQRQQQTHECPSAMNHY